MNIPAFAIVLMVSYSYPHVDGGFSALRAHAVYFRRAVCEFVVIADGAVQFLEVLADAVAVLAELERWAGAVDDAEASVDGLFVTADFSDMYGIEIAAHLHVLNR